MLSQYIFIVFSFFVSLLYIPSIKVIQNNSNIDLKLVTDEAEAAIMIIEKNAQHQDIKETDWNKLFTSEPYIRLKKREEAMKHPFTDDEFKKFLLSDTLKPYIQLYKATLHNWQSTDLVLTAQKSLKYLPEGAKIKAKIYPVIKPKKNSFVFESDTDPAIFLYLNTNVTKEKFENTLAHELHHIGFAGTCSEKVLPDSNKNYAEMTDWMGAFGEGIAMLAAAGGPDIHPHNYSIASDRERWDNDMKNLPDDIRRLNRFFLDIYYKKLTDEQIQDTGFSFFGIQGPWYTVGWKMASVVEKKYGKKRLINCLCNMGDLLILYNEAVDNSVDEKWSEELMNILKKSGR
jgi:hypothetical protein